MSAAPRQISMPVYNAIKISLRFWLWLFCRVEVVGRENIPAQGPFLVVANHMSMADPPLVFVNIPHLMTAMVADKYRHTPIIAPVFNAVGGIWIARGEADLSALKTSLTWLRAGRVLGIAPEGTRSFTGALQKAKTGAAYLADRTGVPLLPLGIIGSENVSANLKRLRRTSIRVIIGPPFRLPPDGRAKGEKLEEYTDLIMQHIVELLPPQYHGFYAGRWPSRSGR